MPQIPSAKTDLRRRPSWLAYVLPMAVFLVFTLAESAAAGVAYVLLYVVKVCAVTAALYVCRATWRDVKISGRVLLPAVAVGLAVFAQWVLLDRYVNYYRLGGRAALNPFEAVADPALRAAFLVARFYGLALVVPFMEELFWRSFLLRYLTDSDFEKVPVGEFSWAAFALVASAFALSHPEWLPALVTACAYALLLRSTKSLFACVVAHAVTNLALGLYVVASGQWHLW